jgi:hypothetical protein
MSMCYANQGKHNIVEKKDKKIKETLILPPI